MVEGRVEVQYSTPGYIVGFSPPVVVCLMHVVAFGFIFSQLLLQLTLYFATVVAATFSLVAVGGFEPVRQTFQLSLVECCLRIIF